MLQEAIPPTPMTLMQIADSPQTPSELKRKSKNDESSSDAPPKKKAARGADNAVTLETIADAPTESAEPTPSTSKDTRSKTKMPKRFENVTIPRGSQPDSKNMPQQM